MRSFLILLLIATATLAGTPLPQTAFFVQNEGQWDGAFSFKYDAPGATYFLTESGMTLDLHSPEPRTAPDQLCHPERSEGPRAREVRGHVLRLSYVSANPTPHLTGEDKLPSYSNYFLSKDSCKWRSRVGHYRSVTAKDVWLGIDVQYRIASQGVETVYHVRPGTDPSLIQLRYEGQDAPIAVDANGRLLLSTSLGLVTEAAPFAYQNINHTQIEIPCRYELTAEGGYRFVLGPYDATYEVVIDPLVYCSYWGGNSPDEVYAFIEDQQQQKLATGVTLGEAYFPLTPGAYCDSANGWVGFLSKFTPGCDTLRFSTYLLGTGPAPLCLAADAHGAVYIAGRTFGELPLTRDAFDTTCSFSEGEGYIARLSADGATLEFSSYLGGSGMDEVHDITTDSSGLVYLSGETQSPDFVVTTNALFPQMNGLMNGFLAVFDPQTSALNYSTFFPAHIIDQVCLTVGGVQEVWLSGEVWGAGLPTTADALQAELHGSNDGFFAHINLQADSLLYCSYLGGTLPNNPGHTEDAAAGVIPLGRDTVLLWGGTRTPDFPVTPDAFDTVSSSWGKVFLTQLALPATIIESTLLGGDGAVVKDIARDEYGSFVICGKPRDRSFPLTYNADDTTFHSMYLSRLSSDLRRLEYSTFLAGGNDLNNDYIAGFVYESRRAVWLGGSTMWDQLPVTPDALVPQYQGFGWEGFMFCYASPEDTSDVALGGRTMPQSFSLSCFPNPFNPTTTLSFTLPASSEVKLEVFDVLGRSVYQQNLGRLTAGEH
ncbi:MAG TPA: hypothetical protein VGL38_11945, partial [bacterium]